MVTHQLQVERRTEKVRQSETDVLPLCYATNQSKFIYPKSLGRFDKLETSGAGCCIAGMMINVLAYADDIVLMAPSCARQPSRGKYRAATRAGYHASAALASQTGAARQQCCHVIGGSQLVVHSDAQNTKAGHALNARQWRWQRPLLKRR